MISVTQHAVQRYRERLLDPIAWKEDEEIRGIIRRLLSESIPCVFPKWKREEQIKRYGRLTEARVHELEAVLLFIQGNKFNPVVVTVFDLRDWQHETQEFEAVGSGEHRMVVLKELRR